MRGIYATRDPLDELGIMLSGARRIPDTMTP
jgi:hypothetical protein